MKLYIMRHGQTAWNRVPKLQGRTDIPLNEYGRRAAELTREGLKNVHFDIAFTSPLLRAKETTELILQGRDISVIDDERLIEIDFGPYEGKSFQLEDENLQNFFAKPEAYYPIDESESFESVLERTGKFLSELYKNSKYQDSVVLISTHGVTLCGLLCNIKKWGKGDFWKGGLHKNCGFSIVEVINEVPRILEEAIVAYDENELTDYERKDGLKEGYIDE